MLAVKLLLVVVTFRGSRIVVGDFRGNRRNGRVSDPISVFLAGSKAPHTDLVRNARRTKALSHVEGGPSYLPLLGRDDDYAVRTSKSVNRAGRGTLEHLDALDVVRVDVSGTIDALILGRPEISPRGLGDRVQTVGDLGVIDDHAIDDVEREEARVDRRDPAQLDLHTTARRAGVLGDDRARDLSLQGIVDRLGRYSIELFTRNDGDRVCGVYAGHSSRSSRNYLRLELQNIPGEGYAYFSVSRGYSLRLDDVADAADAQRYRPVGNVRSEERRVGNERETAERAV